MKTIYSKGKIVDGDRVIHWYKKLVKYNKNKDLTNSMYKPEFFYHSCIICSDSYSCHLQFYGEGIDPLVGFLHSGPEFGSFSVWFSML